VLFFLFFLALGPKLLQMQNLGGHFVVFFLKGQNLNFVKVKGLKLQLTRGLTSDPTGLTSFIRISLIYNFKRVMKIYTR